MELWTIQMAQWRVAKVADIPVMNITVKTGSYVFYPSWSFLTDYQNGVINEEEYTELYLAKMRESYLNFTQLWLNVLNKPKVALACYCPADVFCHRHLLADLFKKVADKHGIDCVLKGELLPNQTDHDVRAITDP